MSRHKMHKMQVRPINVERERGGREGEGEREGG